MLLVGCLTAREGAQHSASAFTRNEKAANARLAPDDQSGSNVFAVQDQELKESLRLTLRNFAFAIVWFLVAFAVGLLVRELLDSRLAGAVAWIVAVFVGVGIFYTPGWRVLTSRERERLLVLTLGTLVVEAIVILLVPAPWALIGAAVVSLPALHQWVGAIRRSRAVQWSSGRRPMDTGR